MCGTTGYVVGSKVLDPTVPLPAYLVPCFCPVFQDEKFFTGTLVVDFTRYLPGAYASRELTRLGARVVGTLPSSARLLSR